MEYFDAIDDLLSALVDQSLEDVQDAAEFLYNKAENNVLITQQENRLFSILNKKFQDKLENNSLLYVREFKNILDSLVDDNLEMVKDYADTIWNLSCQLIPVTDKESDILSEISDELEIIAF